MNEAWVLNDLRNEFLSEALHLLSKHQQRPPPLPMPNHYLVHPQQRLSLVAVNDEDSPSLRLLILSITICWSAITATDELCVMAIIWLPDLDCLRVCSASSLATVTAALPPTCASILSYMIASGGIPSELCCDAPMELGRPARRTLDFSPELPRNPPCCASFASRSLLDGELQYHRSCNRDLRNYLDAKPSEFEMYYFPTQVKVMIPHFFPFIW